MTDRSSDNHELIRLYLAGRLGEAEELMVQTRIVGDSEFRSEVELTAAMKVGMRTLDRRGEIARLLAVENPRWWGPRFVIAASLAALALGVASYLFWQTRLDHPSTAATETLRFERMRESSDGADVVWERGDSPPPLDFRFDVGLVPAPHYRVTFRQASAKARPTVDVVVSTSSDGEIVLSLDGNLLEQGDYEIHLEPQPATEKADMVTFTLAVTGKSARQ